MLSIIYLIVLVAFTLLYVVSVKVSAKREAWTSSVDHWTRKDMLKWNSYDPYDHMG